MIPRDPIGFLLLFAAAFVAGLGWHLAARVLR